MHYRVTVKPNHPTGIRRRDGVKFTTQPVDLDAEQMTNEIRKDPWFIVEKVKAAKVEEVKAAKIEKTEDKTEGSGSG